LRTDLRDQGVKPAGVSLGFLFGVDKKSLNLCRACVSAGTSSALSTTGLGHDSTWGGRTGGDDEQLLKAAHPSESAVAVSSNLSVFILKSLDGGRVVRGNGLRLSELGLHGLASRLLSLRLGLPIDRLETR